MEHSREAEFAAALRGEAYASAWRYCCRLSGRREDAEDLLQDSLAQACSAYGQLRDKSRFRAWLLSIVRRQFLMAIRGRRLSLPLSGNELEQYSSPDPDGELVIAAMQHLGAEQREALAFFYIDGLSLAELGQVLGIPAIAARHRLHRARLALRRRVADLLGASQGKGLTREREI